MTLVHEARYIDDTVPHCAAVASGVLAIEAYHNGAGVETLTARADRLIDRLAAEPLPDTLPPRYAAAMHEALDAYSQTGDAAGLVPLGLDFTHFRPDVLATALVTGRPIELHNQLPSLAPGLSRNHTGCARLLADLTVGGSRLLNTMSWYYSDDYLPPGQSEVEYRRRVSGDLWTSGVLSAEDASGAHMRVLLQSAADDAALQALEWGLTSNGYGRLIEDGELRTFVPHREYQAWAARKSGIPPKQLERAGLALRLPGHCFPWSRLAADMLARDPRALSLTIAEVCDVDTYRSALTLSRLAGGGGSELNQGMFYQSPYNNDFSLTLPYALAQLLLIHARTLRANIGRLAVPEQLSAMAYNDINYGREVIRMQRDAGEDVEIPGILPEDILCRRALITELANRFPQRTFRSMVDAYCGPGTSLPRILEPFLDADARITMLDRSADAIDYQQRWIAGTLNPDDQDIAVRDMRLFATHSMATLYVPPSVTLNTDQRARARATAVQGDIRSLPPNSCDVLTEGYGSCSSKLLDDGLPPTYEDFVHAQRVKFSKLVDGGVAVALHMLRRKGWDSVDVDTGEPITHPSVYLKDGDTIREAYEGAGFVRVSVHVVEVDNPHHGVAEKGETTVAMAVVVAEKPGVRPVVSRPAFA